MPKTMLSLALYSALVLMPAASLGLEVRSHTRDTASQNVRQISVDASNVVGTLKNLQG